MAEMRALTQYFSQFDGSGKSWEEVEPYMAACFSPKVSIITITKEGQGSTGYDEWANFLKGALVRKADIQMTKLEKLATGIEYTACLIYPDSDKGPITFSSLAEFEGGKIVKIHPPGKK
jgi:hypothetical protein